MIHVIERAVTKQGIPASWRGEAPANGAEITQPYVEELIAGFPRLNYPADETRRLDLVQLASDFDVELAAELVKQQQDTEDAEDETAIKADDQVKALILSRPAQIDTYIENNVTDLASAKAVLKIIAKAVSAIGKRQFR